MTYNNTDAVAHVIITYFLSALMKIERERSGLTRKTASLNAGWSAGAWAELERGARALQPHHFIDAAEVLVLTEEEIVRRLNAFIGKHPNLWLERTSDDQLSLCERKVTSPRALRQGNIVNVDLNQIRPSLYYELSSFTPEPEKIIECATELGFFEERETIHPPSQDLPLSPDAPFEARQDRLVSIILDLPEEKFGLLERVVDKFQRFSAKDLAFAYQLFSLSISRQ
ncbi:MAG: helix-turn-helix transcriptional regulator [Myxococcota bacterium]|nr:helix-turn-helix transcriptional regulator [Myxococcota bacterium]